MFLKRVKAHAVRRELPTSVLETLYENFADFLRQESKVDVHPICSYVITMSYANGFNGSTFHVYACKNRKSFGNDKEIRENYGVGFSLFSLFFFVFSNKPLPYVDLDSSFCSFCGISKARFFTPLSRGHGLKPGRCGCKCSLRPAAG